MSLGRGCEHGAENQVVGTLVESLVHFRSVVGGDSDQKSPFRNPAPNGIGRQGGLRQVDPMQVGRQRDVQAVIDQDPGVTTPSHGSGLQGEPVQFPSRQILFPNLNKIDSRVDDPTDLLKDGDL